MKTNPRYCLVCKAELPPDGRANKRYCNHACRQRATDRRKKGLPIADGGIYAAELQTLRNQNQHYRTRTARLEHLIHRMRHIHRKRQSIVDNATRRIASATAAAEEAERQRAETVAAYAAKLSATQRKLEQAEEENLLLTHRIRQLHTLEEERGEGVHYIRNLQNTHRPGTNPRVSTLMQQRVFLTDYLYFAQWYFRKKDRSFWDASDTNRLKRLNTIRAARTKK